MNELTDALARIAAQGERAYEHVPRPGDGAAFVVEARRVGRRRAAARVGAAAAAVAALVVGGAALLPRLDSAPGEPGDIVWTRDVGAEMFGAPLVVGDRAYVGANDHAVHAIDVRDGDPLWVFETGGDVRAAVATDGELLFVASDDTWVYALRDTGGRAEEVWRAKVADRVQGRTYADAYAAAPVVAGDVVIVGSQDGAVYALERGTGSVAWTLQTSGAIRGTPAVDATSAYVGSNDGWMYAVDLATGAVRWRHAYGRSVTASPLVVGGLVIAGSRGAEVVALDAATGEQVWTYPIEGWAEASPAELGDAVVFGSSAAGQVAAVRIADGSPVWEAPAYVRGWPWPRPAVADGTVYVTTALVDDDVDWPHNVYAIDGVTGATVWQTHVGDALEWNTPAQVSGALAPPTVAGDVVLVAGLDGVLYAFAR